MECSSYRRSRRRFMQAGAASLATLLGMNVRDLVAATSAVKAAGKPASCEHVILLWMVGGMSHIDTFDPKPGRPTAGEFKPIRTSASGVEISEILPLTAEQMKHAALIRSIAGVEGAHELAQYHLQTGYRRAPQLVHPPMGSMVVSQRASFSALPSFVSINSRAMTAGYLGHACDAYYIGQPGQPDPYLSLPRGVTEMRRERRLELLQSMNRQQAEQLAQAAEIEATEQTYAAAREFLQSPALEAFNLEAEPATIRESYGDSSFGRGCLLARRLVEQGVRFAMVSTGGFDTHSNNFPAMRGRGAEIDPAIASLIRDLDATGRLDKTMVIVLSEFGRTPRVNMDGGRDHHPGVFSALLAGGGVKPGTVIGASDPDGYRPSERPVRVPDIHATVCTALGVDPQTQVSTPLGRAMKLVEGGTPVRELLA